MKGANDKDYEAFLGEVRKATGIDGFTPGETGLVTLGIDEKYTLSLQYLAPAGKILCFVEIATLGPETPCEVYRELLAAGLFGAETAGGFFALEKSTGTLVYNYYFDFDEAAADPGAFVNVLERIVALCDGWAERLKESGDGQNGERGNMISI